MWYRNKKEDDEQNRPRAAAPEDEVREAIPMTAYPSRQTDYGAVRAGAVIGKSLVVTGQINGKEDLVLDGRMEGDIDLPEHRLTIGATGHLQGRIRAREIVIHGTVQGNLEAGERIEIKKQARVIGDMKAQRPVIEDEAYFKGNVETIREAPKPKVQAATAQAAAAHPAPSPATPAQPVIPALENRPETRKG